MNLVQQQEALRTLPIPVLQAKAQGQDPSIPAWLATAVLNERMSAQQKAGLAQGAAQGQQPSVAEQLEQKAGLMALQAQQQQQAQQQMMQQMAQAPQAVPQEVPQPQPQPQAPAMMASGGIARLPINPQMFNYKEGGVIGFAGGSQVPLSSAGSNIYENALREFLKSIGKTTSEFANADSATRKQIVDAFEKTAQVSKPAVAPSAVPATAPGGGYAAQPAPRGLQALRAMLKPGPAAALGAGAALSYGATKALENMSPEQRSMLENAGGGDDTAMAAAIMNAAQPAPQAAPQAQEQATGSVFTPGSQSGLRPAQNADGIASLQKPPRPVARPAPEPAQQAATPPVTTAAPPAAPSEVDTMALAALREKPAERTMEQARAEYEAAKPELLRQPAGLEMLNRLKQQQAQYEKSKESLPMENWMRGLAAAARGGIGGFGMADIENTERNRAADAAQADYQNKVMTAVEAMQRGEATTEQKSLLDDVSKSRTSAAEAARNRLTALTNARGQDIQSRTQMEVAALDRDSRERIAKLERDMREAHYRNPISAPTEKEKWVQAYRRAGLSETAAIEKVMEVLGEGRAKIAAGRIDAANAKILAEDSMYVNAHKIILDPNSSADAKAKAKLTIAAKEAALNIAPEVAAPTITSAQKAALEKYGVK